jgi:hypothetical protein
MINASMVEMVDTTDLKSVDFGHPGSSPGVRTIVHNIGKSNDLELQNYATVLSGVT